MTHDELTQAITAAREASLIWQGTRVVVRRTDRLAHLDTLQAILDLHKPWSDDAEHCSHCHGWDNEDIPWPCPTVRLVGSALRNMGAP
jgi:hypothetical protein